jgi:hypothetical protein
MIKVNVEHDGYNWVAIPECGGTTSARRIDQLAERICEVVELMTGQTVTPEQLDLDVHVPGAAEALQARAARQAAEDANALSAELTSAAVAALSAAGCSVRDIGALVGVSYQRVHQLSPRSTSAHRRTRPRASESA